MTEDYSNDRRERGKVALAEAPAHVRTPAFGGPSVRLQERYRQAMVSRVSFTDWCEIIDKAVEEAKEGNRYARDFLARYIMGPPPEETPKVEDHRQVHVNLSRLSDSELRTIERLVRSAAEPDPNRG